MSLKDFLREKKVDEIAEEDDSEFIETEYELTHEYFNENGFTEEDLEEFHKRGFDDDTLDCWKEF